MMSDNLWHTTTADVNIIMIMLFLVTQVTVSLVQMWTVQWNNSARLLLTS